MIVAGMVFVMAGCGGGNGASPPPAVTGIEAVLYSFAGPGADGSYPHGRLIQANDGNFYGLTSAGGAANLGTVFKITPAGVETVLHSFTGGSTDGATPYGSLIQAVDGNLYGMTYGGGANNKGTVFTITTAGVEKVLHSFAGSTTDGDSPYGSLVQASDGYFYGMSKLGGASNLGTVFRITTLGAVTVLHSFAGGAADGANPYGSLIQGSDLNLYGMTSGGGASGAGTVFEVALATTGAETLLHSFTGSATDGATPYGSLVQARDGNLYGMSYSGGAYNFGTVFRVTTAGTETLLYSLAGGTADGANPYGSLIQASDGNLYGTTVGGGASNFGAVFRITTAGTETLLYSFAGGTADGDRPQGSLVQATDGNLYGMTYSGGANNLGVVFKIQ